VLAKAGEFEAVVSETARRMLHPDHQTDATLIVAEGASADP